MSDNTTPPHDESPEDKERRERNAEMFADIDDEASDNTAELLAQINRLTTALGNAQRDNLELHTRADEARRSLQRAEQKAEDDKKFAIEKFIKEILPVVDTMELGLKAIPQAERANDPKFDKLADGVEKTLSQLAQVFNRFGITTINPINQQFDENKHEALAVVPKPGVEPETVVDVQLKGYEINGRLIRAAKVVVTPSDM